MLYLQVDCAWCVASHDRQSPHFYALCDAPFQSPDLHGWGFFYVQEVRYIAIEHMDVRRDCVNFARHPNAWRDCVSFARHPNAHVNFARHPNARRDCVNFARHSKHAKSTPHNRYKIESTVLIRTKFQTS